MKKLIQAAVVILIASAAPAGAAAEGVIWISDSKNWEAAPAEFSYPMSWVTETLEFAVGATRAGSYPSLTGGSDWNAWSISAGNTRLTADGALVYATASGASLRLDFAGKPGTDGSGLHGVGGDFFLRNEDGTFFNGEILIELSNGEALVANFSKTNPFAGFWSTDPLVTITSMTLSPFGLTPPDFSIGIRDLYLGYAGVAGSTSGPVQWRVEDGGNGHWYQFDPVVRDWNSAMQAAAAIGGHGVTIHSDAENNLAFALSVPCCNAVWLGGRAASNSCSDPDSYYWLTGEPMTYTDWRAGEPNGWNWLPDAGCALSFYPKDSTPGWNDTPVHPEWVGPSIIEWSADCNNDGIVDYGQIFTGQLADANANGVPDLCEQPTCVDADIYRDFNVNGADLGILLSQWGPITPLTESDLNDDGVVNGADLGLLLSFWGACP